MSRSKKDKRGGHRRASHYDREDPGIMKALRRKRRYNGKRLLEDAPPEKSTGGWLTW